MVHLNQCIHCSEKFEDNVKMMTHMNDENHVKIPKDSRDWDSPEYFFPTYENDNFLLNCLDDDVYEENGEKPPVEFEDLPKNLKESILIRDDVRESICPLRVKK